MKRSFALLALVVALAPAVVQAQRPQTRQGFGISFGVGGGSVGASCDFCSSDREDGFSGYLRLGGYVRPNLLIAGESNGWSHSEDGADQVLGFYTAVAQWYPNVETGLYLKGGLGFVGYVAENGTDDLTAGGLGLSTGIGYDIRVSPNFSLTPYVNFLASTKAELKLNDISTGANVSANLFQIGLGFTWH